MTNPWRRWLLYALAAFAVAGAGTWWMKQKAERGLPPPMLALLQRVVTVERPLRDAVQRASMGGAQVPAAPEDRQRLVAELEKARAAALKAEQGFRAIPVPPKLSDIPEIPRALEAKARMAALSAKAIEANIQHARGEPGAQERLRQAREAANAAAAEASRLLKEAMQASRPTT